MAPFWREPFFLLRVLDGVAGCDADVRLQSCSGLACFRRNDAISETGAAQALRAGKQYASLTVEGTSQSPSPILRASIKRTNRNGFGPTQEYFSGLPIVQW